MTLDCNNTQLQKGSNGEKVREVQTLLKTQGYYTAKIDGQYGDLTVTAVKAFQKAQKTLAVDGIVGAVTCKKLQSSITPTPTPSNPTVFTNTKLCEKQQPDCAGQISGYHCAPHSIKQSLRRFGITKYTEKTIGQYAGTTTAGTGHSGIETALYQIAKKEGITLKVEWKNFSDLGSTQKERFKKYGDLMTDEDKAVFHHELYRGKYGHYSLLKQVNTNNSNLIVQNSLGNKCGSGYYGYMENRGYGTQASYIAGISQKSICIITKV